MPLWEGFKLALVAIWSHKLRAFLTTLGILIGVATVIMMLSVVRGIDGQVVRELDAIGANVFYITKFPALMISSNWRKWASRKDLTLENAREIKRRAPGVAEVSPYHWTQGKQVRFRDRKTDPNVYVVGATESYLDVSTEALGDGRFFTAAEIDRVEPVCVLGMDVVEELFPFSDPIGQSVRVDDRKCRVVGTLEPRGRIWGQSQDNQVIIPFGLFERHMRRHDKENFSIAVKGRGDVPIHRVIEQARMAMRISRGLKTFDEDDFNIETRDSILTAYTNITGAIFAAAIGIAFISLLVGGIGIMNIMLVSVTERTREIGVRKSVGAKRRDILLQFLIEAVAVSAVGGALGITVGVAGLQVLAHAIEDLPIEITARTILLGFFFSVGTGIFFGVLPARKAARLDPIVCLRYE